MYNICKYDCLCNIYVKYANIVDFFYKRIVIYNIYKGLAYPISAKVKKMKNNKQLLIYELSDAYNIDIYSVSVYMFKKYIDKEIFFNVVKKLFSLYENARYALCDIEDIVNLIQDSLNIDNKFRYSDNMLQVTFYNMQGNMIAFFDWRK